MTIEQHVLASIDELINDSGISSLSAFSGTDRTDMREKTFDAMLEAPSNVLPLVLVVGSKDGPPGTVSPVCRATLVLLTVEASRPNGKEYSAFKNCPYFSFSSTLVSTKICL